jgi:hypothetical protein
MTSGFGPVKAKNFANAMSTELVTADEILPRITELDVEVQINGKSCGRGNTAGMQHSIGEMAAYASLGERVVGSRREMRSSSKSTASVRCATSSERLLRADDHSEAVARRACRSGRHLRRLRVRSPGRYVPRPWRQGL